MANLIESIRELFERMNANQIDWKHIDETRARLVQMRFKQNGDLTKNQLNFEPDVDRPNTNLSSNSTFNIPLRHRQRQAIVHWRGKDMEALSTVPKERELAETLLSESSHPILYANEDWYYKNRSSVSGQYEPIVIPGITYDVDPAAGEMKCLPMYEQVVTPGVSPEVDPQCELETKCLSQYQPFLIPGVTFDVDPAHPEENFSRNVVSFPELEGCESVSQFDPASGYPSSQSATA